ncbi:hypothetical protein SynBIOSU31_02938 [Synechococcus sp. BIOS-U3-1]|nr:hypothetical protein SynBIOSU31_02938 [Synechococcus sp. BIOS-U3-1]
MQTTDGIRAPAKQQQLFGSVHGDQTRLLVLAQRRFRTGQGSGDLGLFTSVIQNLRG